MLDERRQEAGDLADYQVLDSADTLACAPGDDPLDRGVATPERWSAAMRFGSTAAEHRSGASHDRLLAREDPDDGLDSANDRPDGISWDANATDDDIANRLANDGPAPRAGRLIRAVADEAVYRTWEIDAVARDVGIDGGGATAEEAALHVVPDEQTGPV
ncbi:MAG: hypothetical protein J2P28_10765 [Actinobacteria bacterium]|nr:hypothetical protein [Actinomycetota bacterium]MBO0835986.1 hypothetical protein [Actinomycetota bacterium]